MAIEQTVLFTVLPRGLTASGNTRPVSVFVAPRLYGADRLGNFPDWLNWTQNLKENGLQLELRCNGQSHTASIRTEVLRPDLWAELFHEDTLVRSHTFDDYTERGILSYPVRLTLSALKSVYQEASVTLALPDTADSDNQEESQNRRILRGLVEGLDAHWSGRVAPQWREQNRALSRPQTFAGVSMSGTTPPLDREGLIPGLKGVNAYRTLARHFSVFHNMPTPERKDHPLELDTDNLLDFHQALSSLNAYPELLRALGIVFDLDLPRAFVTETPTDKFGTLSVRSTSFEWSLPTKTPELATAYLHFSTGRQRFFTTAPRVLQDPNAPTTVLGLLNLDRQRFGLAQVDVDGGMHKTIILAETLNNPDPERNLFADAGPGAAPHPEVFDPGATLPSLRSGGFSLFADRRGLAFFDMLTQGKVFNSAIESGGAQPRPFFVEDLVRGYRLDVWDSRTESWRSLHRRSADYQIGEKDFHTNEEEGFLQSAATQPAKGAQPETNDLYLHEAFARWAGWSLSAPMPAKALSRYGDPDKAIPPDGDDPEYRTDQPETPFKMTVQHRVLPGSLPLLRFGVRYRFRARAVDIAGNSLPFDDPLAASLSLAWGQPLDPEGFAYLRYEPVGAPLLVMRDTRAVTDPGSALDRIVIRTYNAGIDNDAQAADTTAADRHLLPPRTSVEMGERLGMFDDVTGKLKTDAATWQLIADRDQAELPTVAVDIAGNTDNYPIETAEQRDTIPYLPDPLSRGVALRDLPGTPEGTLGNASPGAGAEQSIPYAALSDPNPRPGSATLIQFGGDGDWQQTQPIRLTLAEPAAGQEDLAPRWNPTTRLLTLFLTKGQTKVIPISSYMTTDDLKLMGVWQWLREYIERLAITAPGGQDLRPGFPVDGIAYVLQRAVEGGHWMLTPPRLVTLVHAVQQPLGRPAFTALHVNHETPAWETTPLETAPIASYTDPTELAPVTAYRRPGATDAYLIGALQVHGASTEKVDILAVWDDPIDDLKQPAWQMSHRAAHVDELPLRRLREHTLWTTEGRSVGYYDPEHDQIGFTRSGDYTGDSDQKHLFFSNSAPRHLIQDTKRHRITYTAVATSRYREYFPQDQDLDFTRESEPVLVDVPASERPIAPEPAYILPTFGWQRQTETNLKRSIRFGGGLRVYLHRPWFSSGEGELLGVTLWSHTNGTLNQDSRTKFKPYFTQWGMDPIWETGNLGGAPSAYDFPDAVSSDYAVSLEEQDATLAGKPGRVDVVGFPVEFDESRGLWFADLTVNVPTETYMPFIRLALVRYQPHALADAKISQVFLADFAQLTPYRAALITTDPHHARTLRVAVSGVAPRGPEAVVHGEPRPADLSPHPTQIYIRVQERDPEIQSDLAWVDVPATEVTIQAQSDGPIPGHPDVALWAGTVTFTKVPEPNRYRLLIEEYEYISANYTLAEGRTGKQSGRLVYAETMLIDTALVEER
jgi:hypothetical protein